MTILRLARLSDAPPPVRDLLEVTDDGSMTGWRSQGPLVGRFAGSVPDLDGLRALADAVAGAPAPSGGDAPLDATVERLRVGEATLEAAVHARVDGPWGELLAAARQLLDEALPGSPAAAVALEIVAPDRLRLVHRGGDPLVLELGSGWAEATRWRDGTPVGDVETRTLGHERVEVGPGWTAEVPLRIPGGEPGDLVTASAWFVADDAGVHVPVVLTGRLEAEA